MGWLLWALLSALFAGLTAILTKLGVQNIDSNFATAIRTTVVLFLAWTICFFRSTQSFAEISSRGWLFLTLSGFATGASWLCYFKALQLGEVSKVAPVDKLSIVVAIFLAVVFLNESFTWRHGVGSFLILVGSLVLIGA